MPFASFSAASHHPFLPSNAVQDHAQFSSLLPQSHSLPVQNTAAGQRYHQTYNTLSNTYASLAYGTAVAPDAQHFASFQDQFGAFKLAQKIIRKH